MGKRAGSAQLSSQSFVYETVVWQRPWPGASSEASAGPTCRCILTSWEFLGELSSRSELCGHRIGVHQQAVREPSHSWAWGGVLGRPPPPRKPLPPGPGRNTPLSLLTVPSPELCQPCSNPPGGLGE